jgi:hypothetical protein
MTMAQTRKSKQQIAFDRLKREIIPQLVGQEPRVPLMRGLDVRQTKGGIPVGSLHFSADPDRDPEINPAWKQRERKTYTSQAAWDREQEIVDEAGGGERVFADVLLSHWDKIVIQDERWEPDPDWDVTGGFDHGKTNPTCLLRAYVDYAGNIIFAGEYYMPGKEIAQHAPAMKRMRDFERMENVQADPSMFHGTNQQEQRPGHAQERAKSFADLYAQAGVTNLLSFGGDDKSDVSFAARLMLHWSDLEHRMPSVRIVCRKGLYLDKPQPGLQHWDCPNLLWELMVARRVKLTAQQLLSRNTSEAIVDKDNHARDAMKYLVMSLPEPSRKSKERRVAERAYAVSEEAKKQGATDDQAATNMVLQYTKIMHQEVEDDNPSTYYGGNARRRIRMIERQNWSKWRRGR